MLSFLAFYSCSEVSSDEVVTKELLEEKILADEEFLGIVSDRYLYMNLERNNRVTYGVSLLNTDWDVIENSPDLAVQYFQDAGYPDAVRIGNAFKNFHTYRIKGSIFNKYRSFIEQLSPEELEEVMSRVENKLNVGYPNSAMVHM